MADPIPVEHKCRNYGDRPGCLGVPDPELTMQFDDIGEESLFWCSFCGPEEHKMLDALEEAFKIRPGFAQQLEEAITQAENTSPRKN